MSIRPERMFSRFQFITECRDLAFRVIDHHAGGIGPEPLDIIKFPDRFIKDVNYHVAVIHKDPFAAAGALDPQG